MDLEGLKEEDQEMMHQEAKIEDSSVETVKEEEAGADTEIERRNVLSERSILTAITDSTS